MRLLTVITLLGTALTAPAQDWAKKKLEASPRHGEWVKVTHNKRTVECFQTFPEVKGKATAVVVIHEIFGMTDWVKLTADEFSEAGCIAIAPDLLSGMAPKGGGTAELASGDVRKVIGSLPPEQITADLNAVVEHAAKLPACNGKVVVVGFCWGGGQAFRFATHNKTIKAALPFYGTGPEKAEDIAKITAPVHGFYGENDARVNATIEKSTDLMKAAKKTYEPVIYKGAGHGFFRAGAAPDAGEANKKAREDAWVRIKDILKKLE